MLKLDEQPLGQPQHVFAGQPTTQDDGQQLGRRERLSPDLDEAFSRPLRFGHIPDHRDVADGGGVHG
jgi:hypothetical protein